MIRIYNIKDVSDQDIFLRQTGVKDVSDPVSQIIRRVREGSLLLGDLPPGKWRSLTAAEVAALLGEGGTSSQGSVHTP